VFVLANSRAISQIGLSKISLWGFKGIPLGSGWVGQHKHLPPNTTAPAFLLGLCGVRQAEKGNAHLSLPNSPIMGGGLLD